MPDGDDLDPVQRVAQTLTSKDISDYQRRHRPPANWKKWEHCPKAELWQCVALSFDVEPVEASMRGAQGGFVIGAGPRPKPWFADHSDMRERLEIALANAGSDAVARLHPLAGGSGDMASRMFSTSEFGLWARSIWGVHVPVQMPGKAVQSGEIQTGAPATDTQIAHSVESKVGADKGARPLVVHKLKTRRHALGSIIEKAREAAADANDYFSVWAALVRIAQSPERPAPIVGYVDGEGVKYEVAQSEQPRYFTMKALKEQFSRARAARLSPPEPG